MKFKYKVYNINVILAQIFTWIIVEELLVKSSNEGSMMSKHIICTTCILVKNSNKKSLVLKWREWKLYEVQKLREKFSCADKYKDLLVLKLYRQRFERNR